LVRECVKLLLNRDAASATLGLGATLLMHLMPNAGTIFVGLSNLAVIDIAANTHNHKTDP